MTILSVSLQYKYTDLAAKERAHFTQEIETPNMGHARKMKVVYSDVSLPRSHSYFIFACVSLLFSSELITLHFWRILTSVCIFFQWYSVEW